MASGHTYSRQSTLLSDARQFKDEFLGIAFGYAPQVSAGGPVNAIGVLPQGGNIVGVGYGVKVTSGATVQGQIAVRVYVRAKMPLSSLSTTEVVPPDVNGTPTDVVTVGDVTAHARPTACGISIGHPQITAGTLGCLVEKTGASSGDRYILSNNHVLANTNGAQIGDAILEPGPLDGGDPNNPIAQLTDFELIDFANANRMDAAIAQVLNLGEVTPDILNIGSVVDPPIPVALYQSVRKHGRTTQHTVGVVTDLSADIKVGYGARLANFEDQLAITGAGGLFSSGGDSGSLIVDAVTLQPVALLFAGGTGTTFATPIDRVLARFAITIL